MSYNIIKKCDKTGFLLSMKKRVQNAFRSVDLSNDNIPTITVLIGLPASGKSTFANTLVDDNTIIHSSDKLRKELYGNENIQEHNSDLFVELHRRIKDDLKSGKNVIYDATNISKKRRIAFLEELKNISCKKICICLMTPYELCLKYNSLRDRKVPEEVIKRMYMNWNPPAKQEGFDEVHYHYNYGENFEQTRSRYKISILFEGDCGIDNFSQENSHHTLTLGAHCRQACEYVVNNFPYKNLLHIAALLHDNGKVFTKTRINAKGEEDGDCHYYQHHCVGAYNSLFYTNEMNLNEEEKTYIANLIYFHMHPFTSWRQSEKAKIKSKNQMGDEMYNDILCLHEADLAAH